MIIIRYLAKRIGKMQYWELAMYIAIIGFIVFFVSLDDCKKAIVGGMGVESIYKEEVSVGDLVSFEPTACSECFYEDISASLGKICTFSSERYYYMVKIGADKEIVVSASKYYKDKFSNLATTGQSFKLQGKVVNKSSNLETAQKSDLIFNMMGNLGDASSVNKLTENKELPLMIECKSFVGIFAVNIVGILLVIAAVAVFFIKKHIQRNIDMEFERVKKLSINNKIPKSDLDKEFEKIVEQNNKR